jgi:hypothetical protein
MRTALKTVDLVQSVRLGTLALLNLLHLNLFAKLLQFTLATRFFGILDVLRLVNQFLANLAR